MGAGVGFLVLARGGGGGGGQVLGHDVAVVLLEAELGEGRREVVGEFGGDIQRRAIGVIDDQAAGVEVELPRDAAGEEGLGAAVFAVAHDGMADGGHVDAELVGAAGQRLQFDPDGAVSGAVDGAVERARGGAVFGLVDHHLLAAAAGLLGEREIDQALRRVGDAGDERPVDLFRAAAGEAFGEIGGAAGGGGDEEDA